MSAVQGAALGSEARPAEPKPKSTLQTSSTIKKRKRRGRQRDQGAAVRDTITALALCHNVTPVYPDANDETLVEFQASSPDEIALVKFATSLGMKLLERDQNKIVIENVAGIREDYEILANFPFSSETKRMGIILKHIKTKRILFYLKGAETVMEHKCKPNYRAEISISCENLANEGLRTLVISQKLIPNDFFKEWNAKYEAAKADLNDRERLVQACINELEADMDLLSITGVEDKLQDKVASVIESLRNAGVKVWMLTGDKVETAHCIAISAGFKNRKDRIAIIRDQTEKDAAARLLDDFKRYAKQSVLLIDGQTIDLIFSDRALE
jgi:phospholipid-translocating ATPase